MLFCVLLKNTQGQTVKRNVFMLSNHQIKNGNGLN